MHDIIILCFSMLFRGDAMKKLVCIGGGNVPRYKNGVLLPYETKEIDEEIVKLANKTNPKFLFISLASSHQEEYFDGIKKVQSIQQKHYTNPIILH